MVISDDSKLQVMCKERDSLRLEIIEVEKHVYRSVFAFVTLAGVAASIYWNPSVVADTKARAALFFVLGQGEFFIALVVLLSVTTMLVHSGYAKTLEERINSLCQESLVLWESEVTPTFLFHPRGLYFCSYIILILFLALVAVLFILVTLDELGRWYAGVLAVELATIVILSFFLPREADRVAKYIGPKLGGALTPGSQPDRIADCACTAEEESE